MKSLKRFLILITIFFNIYSLTFSMLGDNIKETNRWELYEVIDEWEEPTGIKIPYFEYMYVKGTKREIKMEDVPKFSNIVYKNQNNDLIMNIYAQSKIIEVETRFDSIKKVKIRFDKKKIVIAKCLTSTELGSYEDEVTGKVYYGNTECTIKLTDEIINLMKKSKEMEIVVPYFESTSLVKVKLDGFSSAIDYYLKHN